MLQSLFRLTPSNIGITATRKTGNAVERNRLRRRVREL
ncbi:MAG: ribonuclease P protein component, partial [Candidatus Omnitrophica bacterium]|nr:ribonuclease P protein component [Candidatus Omnitrophota bacterium]